LETQNKGDESVNGLIGVSFMYFPIRTTVSRVFLRVLFDNADFGKEFFLYQVT
jgi:hypothetical protein